MCLISWIYPRGSETSIYQKLSEEYGGIAKKILIFEVFCEYHRNIF
jgi:hypothetical protein